MQDKLAKAGILAKQFREYYDKKYAIDPTTGEPLYPDARLETIADMVLDILNSKNEEVKINEFLCPNRTRRHLKKPYKAHKYNLCRVLPFYSNSLT